MTSSPAGSLGDLVQDYVDVQCGVILDARTAMQERATRMPCTPCASRSGGCAPR